VLPRLARSDVVDVPHIQIVFQSSFLWRKLPAANITDSIVIEFRRSQEVLSTLFELTRNYASSLRCPICHVVLMRSELKMARINANPVVTLMHDNSTVVRIAWRDWSVCDFPHRSMCSLAFSAFKHYNPISANNRSACPRPALVIFTLFNKAPNALCFGRSELSNWNSTSGTMLFVMPITIASTIRSSIATAGDTRFRICCSHSGILPE
jgi:hypothetical protein